ncbi:MAG: hypothetical protein C1941_06795 [Prosthecochloris sp.]|nr:hypothetical protein [Prosthecochloris sp.]
MKGEIKKTYSVVSGYVTLNRKDSPQKYKLRNKKLYNKTSSRQLCNKNEPFYSTINTIFTLTCFFYPIVIGQKLFLGAQQQNLLKKQQIVILKKHYLC